ncbi:MAG TPA: exodeoxyribonuclease VII small subunit [Patescibacteria group bacterium]|nr:exodeoxyribonuclease VII small subunit [Patescibacteria group bacterium]
MPKPAKENLNTYFADLEKIAEKLQDPNLDIEKSVELFEEGMALAAKAKERLTILENKVSVLKKKYRVNDNESGE